MQVSGILVFAAAVCFTAASLDAAQGPKAGRGAARVQAPAAHTPQGPKADRPQGPKSDRPAQRSGKEPSARGAGRADEARTIAANISKNPQLEARLKDMLPSGMTLEQAAEGFRNQGQFIAAVEASKNRNIPFADLKAEMTGDNALSLGQAIRKLRPSQDAP